MLRDALKYLLEALRELWSRTLVFVFEEQKHVFPTLCLNVLGPVFKFRVAVLATPQTQIAPVGRRDKRDFLTIVVDIRNTERRILFAQRLINLIVEPALISKFERDFCVALEARLEKILVVADLFSKKVEAERRLAPACFQARSLL